MSRQRRGTAITFLKETDGRLIGDSCEGHSGYAEAGSDIVCAGISALTLSILNGLENILQVPVEARQDDQNGYLYVRLTPEASDSQITQAQVLMRTLLEGLQAMEKEYPRYLHIILKERR
ncbi:MAG: ribosomal-processing cysteine protease Prp [Clostridia bacterium]|nr:ribosomal-processing cysteine protease Prp [Clostridia bacterium]